MDGSDDELSDLDEDDTDSVIDTITIGAQGLTARKYRYSHNT